MTESMFQHAGVLRGHRGAVQCLDTIGTDVLVSGGDDGCVAKLTESLAGSTEFS